MIYCNIKQMWVKPSKILVKNSLRARSFPLFIIRILLKVLYKECNGASDLRLTTLKHSSDLGTLNLHRQKEFINTNLVILHKLVMKNRLWFTTCSLQKLIKAFSSPVVHCQTRALVLIQTLLLITYVI